MFVAGHAMVARHLISELSGWFQKERKLPAPRRGGIGVNFVRAQPGLGRGQRKPYPPSSKVRPEGNVERLETM